MRVCAAAAPFAAVLVGIAAAGAAWAAPPLRPDTCAPSLLQTGAVRFQSLKVVAPAEETPTLTLAPIEHESHEPHEPHEPHDPAEEHAAHESHGDHGHGHKEPSIMSISVSVMLLGSVGFQMVLFYLVNWYDKDIREAAWKMISVTVSIFSAVLIFTASKEVMTFALTFGEDVHAGHGAPTPMEMVRSAVRLIFFTILVGVLLRELRRESAYLVAVCGIAAHVNGFAAIDFYGGVQSHSFFSRSVVFSLLAVVLAGGALMLTHLVVSKAQDVAEKADGKVDKYEEQLDELSADAEYDVVGLTLGLLLSRVARFMISGSLPPLHGCPKSKTPGMAAALVCAALAFAGLVLLFDSGTWKRSVRIAFGSQRNSGFKFTRVCQCISSMSMGWCLLYAGQWAFWTIFPTGLAGQESTMLAQLVMALVDSMIVVIALFIIDYVADHMHGSDKMLRDLNAALGLVLGLAWETAFHDAVEEIQEKFAEGVAQRVFLEVSMCLGLCLVVLPAWSLYILPKALQGDNEGVSAGLAETLADDCQVDPSQEAA